jgi:hypothetical protein
VAILIDAHVHLYSCFDLAEAFSAAARNFEAASRVLGLGSPVACVLLLATTDGEWTLDSLGEGSVPGWSVERTQEAESLFFVRAAHEPAGLLLVAGRQVVTSEGLEVLSLGSAARLPAGRPAQETLDAVRAARALPVLAWGVGKWTFGRRRLVARLLRENPPDALFLGDTGGRPRLSRRPRLFVEAERRGGRVLPGSDPLPFRSQAGRLGARGFALRVDLDRERPAASLRRILGEPRVSIVPYGPGERIVPFLRNALRMQWRKLGRRGEGRCSS